MYLGRRWNGNGTERKRKLFAICRRLLLSLTWYVQQLRLPSREKHNRPCYGLRRLCPPPPQPQSMQFIWEFNQCQILQNLIFLVISPWTSRKLCGIVVWVRPSVRICRIFRPRVLFCVCTGCSWTATASFCSSDFHLTPRHFVSRMLYTRMLRSTQSTQLALSRPRKYVVWTFCLKNTLA